jgi:molybdenum cofactor cytidylyltransferase
MVVLGDQPQIKTRHVHQLLTAYCRDNADIVAPEYRGQRGHPIIVGRRYWNDLLDLPHGKAPRDVINQCPILHVSVDDSCILRDIDTPEQYAQERRLAGLD